MKDVAAIDWRATALDHVPLAPFMVTRLAHPPGIAPIDQGEWLHDDATFAAQMAARDALIAGRRAQTVAETRDGDAPARELLDLVVEQVIAHHGARRETGGLRRRDGVLVALDDAPIAVCGRLAQEDFLLMLRPGDAAEHLLVAGVLCFPAHWTLSEKIGRPLLRIHKPVAGYAGDLARRVQRLFDGVRPGRPLVRANWNFTASPDLFTPRREADKGGPAQDFDEVWLRVERQTVARLPDTGATVFGVRSLIAPIDSLTDDQWRGLARAMSELSEAARLHKAGPRLRARIEARRAPAQTKAQIKAQIKAQTKAETGAPA